MALECDMLRCRKCGTALQEAAQLQDCDDLAHTKLRVLDIVQRSFRNSCANSVAIRVMMLSKPQKKIIVNIVLGTNAPLQVWLAEKTSTPGPRTNS